MGLKLLLCWILRHFEKKGRDVRMCWDQNTSQIQILRHSEKRGWCKNVCSTGRAHGVVLRVELRPTHRSHKRRALEKTIEKEKNHKSNVSEQH